MALNSIGVTTLNFKLGLEFETPQQQVRNNRAYAFVIRTLPIATILPRQYVNIIPIHTITGARYERPLAAKFYPKGFEMYFYISVPVDASFRNSGLSLLLQPKSVFPKDLLVDEQQFEILFDDDDVQPSQTIMNRG